MVECIACVSCSVSTNELTEHTCTRLDTRRAMSVRASAMSCSERQSDQGVIERH